MPNPEQRLKAELFYSYRAGWRDGARYEVRKDPTYTEHATRPDLTAEYLRGWADGEAARKVALAAGAERIGYVPNVLRTSETEP